MAVQRRRPNTATKATIDESREVECSGSDKGLQTPIAPDPASRTANDREGFSATSFASATTFHLPKAEATWIAAPQQHRIVSPSVEDLHDHAHDFRTWT